MPKFNKIKWRRQDYDVLKKAVKNFNAKIDRILKKNPYAEGYLPKKVSYKQLKADIQYRNDFNKLVSSLKRFSRKGAEEMITFLNKPMTKWERREGAIAKGNLNRRRAMQKKLLNPSAEKGTLGTNEEMNLRPKKYPTGKTADWDAFIEQLHYLGSTKYEAERAERYLQNYFKAVDNNMGMFADIIKILASRMGGIQLFNIYADEPDLQIDFVYPQGMTQGAQAQRIINAFAKHGVNLTREERTVHATALTDAEYGSDSYEEEMEIYKELYGIPDDW